MTATLLVSCPDRKGLVAALAQLLYAQGANILDADQHSDVPAGMFFQRIRFDDTGLDRPNLEAAIAQLAGDLAMSYQLNYASAIKRIAIYASKQEHCIYDLLIRHKAAELPCQIAFVASNHASTARIAEHFNAPFFLIDPKDEAHQFTLLENARVDLIVLARYMQILSPEFVARYPQRIINIHHSFLPAFVGANPYKQAHEKGVKMVGATSHFVTAELDQGPIIEQQTMRCSHADSYEDLVRKGRDLEKRVLASAVRWQLEDRILVYAGKTVVFS